MSNTKVSCKDERTRLRYNFLTQIVSKLKEKHTHLLLESSRNFAYMEQFFLFFRSEFYLFVCFFFLPTNFFYCYVFRKLTFELGKEVRKLKI